MVSVGNCINPAREWEYAHGKKNTPTKHSPKMSP